MLYCDQAIKVLVLIGDWRIIIAVTCYSERCTQIIDENILLGRLN